LNYRLSTHARQEMERRGIPLPWVEAVLENPDQITPERGALKAYQSKRDIGGKMYLVRVIVDERADPALVVTVYRTTKIEKYWNKP
jgi:uncharacterized protein DUF4258